MFKQECYYFNRSPQGLHNASVHFQYVMKTILDGEDVQVYIDDIVLTHDQEDEHVSAVSCIIKKLSDAGLKTGLKKSTLCKRKVAYLGFLLEKNVQRISQTMKVKIRQHIPTS